MSTPYVFCVFGQYPDHIVCADGTGVDDGVPSLAPEQLACAVACLRRGKSDWSGGTLVGLLCGAWVSWGKVGQGGRLGGGEGGGQQLQGCYVLLKASTSGGDFKPALATAVFFRFAGICDVLTPRGRGTRTVVLSRPTLCRCFIFVWVVGQSPDRIVYAEKCLPGRVSSLVPTTVS